MNIFSFKKQKYPLAGNKQKLFLFSAIILIFFSIFPVLNEAKAQIRGPSAGCELAQNDINNGVVKVSKFKVNPDEAFNIATDIPLSDIKANECKTAGKDDFYFSYYIFTSTPCTSLFGDYNYRVSSEATFYTDPTTNKSSLRHVVTDATLNKFLEGASVPSLGGSVCLSVYVHKKSTAPTNATPYLNYKSGPNDPSGYIINEAGNHQITDSTLLTQPSTAWENLPLNNNKEGAKADELSVSIKPDSAGKGLRSKYRVALTDTSITFGAANGPDAIYADWEGKRIAYNQYIGIPHTSQGTLTYDYTPQFKHVQMYFADGSKAWDPKTVCWKDSANYIVFDHDDCSKIVYVNDSKGVGSDPAQGTKGLLAGTFDPTMKSGIWSQFSNQTAAEGQALGTAELYVIPIVWGDNGYRKSYVLGKAGLKKIAVEVFKTDDDIKAACKNDSSITDKTKCDDLAFAKFGFAETVTQTSTSSEEADRGNAQTLYEFIVKIISSIVIFLTSVIYRIFAYFVVPVINALLGVRPYQDAFVNIIYPGWLILRNLSNIFFIIALLVVGLRILFQQSAAGTARGFIMRLIIMALLVNFSLVIAQGVVGIADTVQSQFLPGNTRVIEALGSKLMVEPILSFRSAVGGGDPNAEIQANANIGDIAKPIVLLMLAVAAFFSFLAIAAFLAVRLVALMILYMVSPIAYVGYVMDETRSYAQKWWSEFMKYAFLTPILVFFLNIAALVATVTSSNQGNVIKIDDTLEAGIVAGGLTIVSHFIVLLIIFAGMKFALSSGTAGSKTIVNYAQKGFKNTFKKPAEWLGSGAKSAGVFAKDTGSDWLARSKALESRPGLQKAIRAAARPTEAFKALKKGYIDIPKERMNDRFADSFSGLTRAGVKYGDDKLLPAKMAWWKLNGNDAAAIRAQAAGVADKQNILTDDERAKKPGELQKRLGLDSDDLDMYERGEMTVQEGVKYLNLMDKDLKDKRKYITDEIDKKIADPATSFSEKELLKKKKIDEEAEYSRLEKARDDVEDEIDAATAAGKNMKFSGLEAELKPHFDAAAVKDGIDEMNKELATDDALRARFGYAPGDKFDDDDRKAAKAEYNSLIELASKKDWPDSPSDRADRAAREKKAIEPWADVDDKDALVAAFKDALESNNLDLASALGKKMAKADIFKDAMQDMGYMNNVEGLKGIMEKGFAKLSTSARANITMEISSLSAQNGNKALAGAISVSGPNGRSYKTLAKQQLDNVAISNKKKIGDMGKGDFAYEYAPKKYTSNKGVIDHINSHTGTEQIKNIKRMSADKAKFVLEMKDSDQIIEPVRKALEEAMGKGKK